MFTGIISDIGTLVSRKEAGDLRVEITTNYEIDTIKMGESIACNGVCLTVIEKGKHRLFFNVSAETLRVSAPSYWETGAKINLERALKLGDDVSGHIVTGHVDSLAKILEIVEIGDSHKITLEVLSPFHRYIAAKGSVTLNGVSLTVNQVEDQKFSINIIPHTWNHTNFQYLQTGDSVNLEIDVLARYMARLLETTK